MHERDWRRERGEWEWILFHFVASQLPFIPIEVTCRERSGEMPGQHGQTVGCQEDSAQRMELKIIASIDGTTFLAQSPHRLDGRSSSNSPPNGRL
ncbi:uncharacterized protein LACBIDRAFT_306710 [Laccaria bicolor S238N-H82]|uniref:Predicted protein n=1 Tax=Laccaria bicolor (strain S238N-H82 / ATCC MYA-4686) TaxID=486041 RepID=B0E4H6_LACBS|nr:uncharacterized protein LACBIDRAFT_306710 [Laccaria bicolor S238N-H82]EDQ98255.1 predicted protein [Laccaria bicolor S238N-H82]|eukprot:XP_001891094.1 predicted protein [Laccaria bicolor S238N-H82]